VRSPRMQISSDVLLTQCIHSILAPRWRLFAEDDFDNGSSPSRTGSDHARERRNKNGAPAPIGGSIDARSNASRSTRNLADTRLAIPRGGSGARENGALALRRSANSRQFDPLAHTNATWGQRLTGGGDCMRREERIQSRGPFRAGCRVRRSRHRRDASIAVRRSGRTRLTPYSRHGITSTQSISARFLRGVKRSELTPVLRSTFRKTLDQLSQPPLMKRSRRGSPPLTESSCEATAS
jgi:hypothetical protein